MWPASTTLRRLSTTANSIQRGILCRIRPVAMELSVGKNREFAAMKNCLFRRGQDIAAGGETADTSMGGRREKTWFLFVSNEAPGQGRTQSYASRQLRGRLQHGGGGEGLGRNTRGGSSASVQDGFLIEAGWRPSEERGPRVDLVPVGRVLQ